MRRWVKNCFISAGLFLVIKLCLAIISFSGSVHKGIKKHEAYRIYKAEKLTPPPDCEGLDSLHFRIGENDFVFETGLANLFFRTENEVLVARMKSHSCVGTEKHPILVNSISLNRFNTIRRARDEFGLTNLPSGISFIRLRNTSQYAIDHYAMNMTTMCHEYSLNYCRQTRLIEDIKLNYSIDFLVKEYETPRNDYQDRPAFGLIKEQEKLLSETEEFIYSLILNSQGVQ